MQGTRQDEELARLRDVDAERAVLCGVLRDARAAFVGLAKVGLTAAEFGHALEMDCFLTLTDMWKRGREINLVSSWHAIRRAGIERKYDLNSAILVADLFTWDWWPSDIMQIWEPEYFELGLKTGLCLAAAKKVKWLATRRDAIYRANEVIRNALDGAIGPEFYEDYE